MAAVTMGGDRLRGHRGGSAVTPQSVTSLRHRCSVRGLRCCVLLPQLAPYYFSLRLCWTTLQRFEKHTKCKRRGGKIRKSLRLREQKSSQTSISFLSSWSIMLYALNKYTTFE